MRLANQNDEKSGKSGFTPSLNGLKRAAAQRSKARIIAWHSAGLSLWLSGLVSPCKISALHNSRSG